MLFISRRKKQAWNPQLRFFVLVALFVFGLMALLNDNARLLRNFKWIDPNMSWTAQSINYAGEKKKNPVDSPLLQQNPLMTPVPVK